MFMQFDLEIMLLNYLNIQSKLYVLFYLVLNKGYF